MTARRYQGAVLLSSLLDPLARAADMRICKSIGASDVLGDAALAAVFLLDAFDLS